MKTKSYVVIPVLFFLGLWVAACGNEETATTAAGSGGSGTTSVNGSVTIPSTTTTSISQGASASKNSGSGEEEESSFSVSKGASDNSSADSSAAPSESVIVSKAVADISAGDGTCQIKTASGTLLDTCIINDGKLSGCDIDTSKLDASKQITIIATVNGKTVSSVADCSSCGAGGLLDSGTTNSSSTTAAGLLYYSCDTSSTVDSPTSACASAIAAGTFSPKQTYQTTIEELGLSDAIVGTDTAKNALLSFKKAIQSYMANNSSFKPSDLLNAIGGGSVLSAATALDSSLSGINIASLATMTKNHASAVGAYFGDATTAAKWTDATGFAAMAKNFGAYGPADLAAVAAKPENARGLLDKYADDYKAGVANAFGKLKDGGKSFGNYLTKFGSTAMSSGQFLAAKDLFDNCTFGAGVDQSKLGEALYSQIFSADTEAEITKLRAQKGSIGGLLVSNPGAYAGSGGLGAAQGLLNLLGTGGSLTGATACASDSDCTGGKLCGSSGLCFASVAGLGTGTGDIGAVCSAAGDCKSNVCTSSRCDIGSGVSFATLGTQKYFGDQCTATSECSGGLTCDGTPATCGGSGGGGGGGGGPTTLYFAYVANTMSNNVSAFSMNATTGVLTPIANYTAGTAPNGLAVSPNGKCLYVPNGTTNDTSVFSINPATGVLTAGTTVSHGGGAGPFGAAVSPDSGSLYVVLTSTAKVAGYSINAATCALTAMNGGSPNHLFSTGNSPKKVVAVRSPNNITFVFTSNAGTGDSISRFAAGADGSLGSGTLGADTGVGNNPLGIVVDATGKFIYTANQVSQSLHGFTINGTTGALTGIAGSPYSDGLINNSLAITPNGSFIYGTTNPGGASKVCGFSVNAVTGVLGYLGGGNCVTVFSNSGAAGLTVDPTGKFLYVLSQGDNTVQAYSINAATGALTLVSSFAAGTTPAEVKVIGIVQ